MNGIVELLLRLEGVKHKALIEGNAPDYDQSVREQLHLLESVPNLQSEARACPEKLLTLSRLIGHNTSLYQNLISTSAIFAIGGLTYSPAGSAQVAAASARGIRVEG